MPLNREGTLKPDEVYCLTAFLLYKNDVIKEDEVMDAQSLPEGEHAESKWIREPSASGSMARRGSRVTRRFIGQ